MLFANQFLTLIIRNFEYLLSDFLSLLYLFNVKNLFQKYIIIIITIQSY